MKTLLVDLVTAKKRTAGLLLALCLTAGLFPGHAAESSERPVSTAEQLAEAVLAAGSDAELILSPGHYDLTGRPLAGKETVRIHISGSGAVLNNAVIAGGLFFFDGVDFAGKDGADGTADSVNGGDGAAALVVSGGSVHVSNAGIAGGRGGDGYAWDVLDDSGAAGGSGGAGGDGLVVSDGAAVALSGCAVQGGAGGSAGENSWLYSGGQPRAGSGGTAIRGSVVSVEDCTIAGGDAGVRGSGMPAAANGGDGVAGVLGGARNTTVRGGSSQWGYGGCGVTGVVIGRSGVEISGGAGYMDLGIYYGEDGSILSFEVNGQQTDTLPAVGGAGVRGEVYGEVEAISGGPGPVGGTGVEGAVHGHVRRITGGADLDPDHQINRYYYGELVVFGYYRGCDGGDGWRITRTCAGAVDSVIGGKGADNAVSGAGGHGGAGVVLPAGVTFSGEIGSAAGGQGGSGRGGIADMPCGGGNGGTGLSVTGTFTGTVGLAVGGDGGKGGNGDDSGGNQSGSGGNGGSGVTVSPGAEASGIGSVAGGTGGAGGSNSAGGGAGGEGGAGISAAAGARVVGPAAVSDGAGGPGGSGAADGADAQTAGFTDILYTLSGLETGTVYYQVDGGGVASAAVSDGRFTLSLPSGWDGSLRAVCGDRLYLADGAVLTEADTDFASYDVAGSGLEIRSGFCLYNGLLCPAQDSYTVTGSGHGTVSARADSGIVLSGANISADGGPALLVGSGADVTVTLAEDTVNTLTGGAGGAGAQVEQGGSLTVAGRGTLRAAGGPGAAGIGGGQYAPAGVLELKSGRIFAEGGSGGAGVGSGAFGGGAEITVSGADVQADSVGGGGFSGAKTVSVTGGRLTFERAVGCIYENGSAISASGGSLVQGMMAVAPAPDGAADVYPAGYTKLTGGGTVSAGGVDLEVTGSAVIEPDGSVELPDGGTVSAEDRDGRIFTFCIPEGEAVRVEADGRLDVPGGASAVIGGQEIPLPEGGAFDPEVGLVTSDHCTVRFDGRGGSNIAAVQAVRGELLVKPENPARSGYSFAGWYADSACTVPWNFAADRVTGDMTLYAKWSTVSSDGGSSGSSAGKPVWHSPYTDVPEHVWYEEAVRFVTERGLMSGYGGGLFGPEDLLSRAQLAQILYSWAGRPAVGGELYFADVETGKWYTDAVSWAAERGVMSGYGGGRFGPADPVTREQLAAVLWRYAGSPAPSSRSLNFSDAEEVSGYAVDALCWAVENGIIYGRGGEILNPRGGAARAEVAAVLMRYIEKLK